MSPTAHAAGSTAWLAPLQQLHMLQQLHLQVPDSALAFQAGDGRSGGSSGQETVMAVPHTSVSSSSNGKLLPSGLTSLTLTGFQEQQLNDLSGPIQALSSTLQALQLQPAAEADPDNLALLSHDLHRLTNLTRLQVKLTSGEDFAVFWNLPPLSQLAALSALRVLEVRGCSPDSDEVPYIDAAGDLSSLANSCPGLQQLGPLYVDAATPPAPGVCFQHLSMLRLAHVPPTIPPLRLADLAPNLRYLAMSVYNRDQASAAVQAISASLTGLHRLCHLHLRMGCAGSADSGLEVQNFRFAASTVSAVLRPLRAAFAALTPHQQQQHGSHPSQQAANPHQQPPQQQQGELMEASKQETLEGETSETALPYLQTLQFTLHLEATQSVRAFSDMISLLHVTPAKQLKLHFEFAAHDDLAWSAIGGAAVAEAAAVTRIHNSSQTATTRRFAAVNAAAARGASAKRKRYTDAFVKCMKHKWACSLEELALCGLEMNCQQVQQLIDGLPHLRFLQLVKCGLSSAEQCKGSIGAQGAEGGMDSETRLDKQQPQLRHSLRMVVQDSIDTSWLF